MDVWPRRTSVRIGLHDVRARSIGDIMKISTFVKGVIIGFVLVVAIAYIGAYLGSK